MSGVIAVVAIIAGLPWGAIGVAASYAATDLFVSTPLLFWYVGRRGPVRTGDLYRTIVPAASASVCSLVVLLVCRQWLGGFHQLFTRLTIAFGINITVSLLVLAALPAGRLAIRNFKEMFIMLLKRKRALTV